MMSKTKYQEITTVASTYGIEEKGRNHKLKIR